MHTICQSIILQNQNKTNENQNTRVGLKTEEKRGLRHGRGVLRGGGRDQEGISAMEWEVVNVPEKI